MIMLLINFIRLYRFLILQNVTFDEFLNLSDLDICGFDDWYSFLFFLLENLDNAYPGFFEFVVKCVSETDLEQQSEFFIGFFWSEWDEIQFGIKYTERWAMFSAGIFSYLLYVLYRDMWAPKEGGQILEFLDRALIQSSYYEDFMKKNGGVPSLFIENTKVLQRMRDTMEIIASKENMPESNKYLYRFNTNWKYALFKNKALCIMIEQYVMFKTAGKI